MSRWRPPGEKSTALITRAGHDRLKAELDELWRVRRPEVVKALADAAAEEIGALNDRRLDKLIAVASENLASKIGKMKPEA